MPVCPMCSAGALALQAAAGLSLAAPQIARAGDLGATAIALGGVEAGDIAARPRVRAGEINDDEATEALTNQVDNAAHGAPPQTSDSQTGFGVMFEGTEGRYCPVFRMSPARAARRMSAPSARPSWGGSSPPRHKSSQKTTGWVLQ